MSLQVNPITHNNPIFFLLTAVVLTAVGSEDAGGGGGGGGRSSVVGGGGGLELLALLQLHNGSRQGVTLTQGPHRMRPAYYLQGSYRELRLPDFAYKKAVDLLRHSTEFTLSASIKQELYNSGTILAFSDGVNRYLEVQSSGRKDEIRLHYTTQREAGEDSGSPTVKGEGGWTVRVETFPYRLADLSWHKLSISVSGSQVQVLVDCHPLYRRLLATPLDTNFSRSSLVLWVGQRNARHSLFKGGLQDVKIVGGPHGYLGQCPQLDVGCPTCGQYTTLEDTVQRLTARLNNLSARLEMAEGRITKVEECDCQKSCSINGSTHADGATWQHNCEICSCVHGDVECRPVQCPKIECKKPVLNLGQCCPTCLKQCYLRGTLYDHGDLVSLKQCVECECRDGSMHCTRIDPETMCPPLSCPQHVQFSVPDECCKFCPGVDYCGKGHTCHANASCLNLETTYACHCDTGFTGDGHNCVDIDECLSEGGLEGHHCRSNTRCHNTPGSYQCQCLPGHRTVDRFNCAEIDECATDQHKCDPHAKCINTQGSYHCQCLEGYAGDVYQCLPVCAEVCENGGRCVDGGVCECRAGYHGSGCQLDVDECSAGLHTCNNATSTCVNMPGWYYCTCAPGYTSVVTVVQSQPVTICQDVDECQLGNHTCHPSAKCVNTQGSYKCICPPLSKGLNNTQANCKLSCWLGEDKGEIEDGGTLVRPKDCQECHCSAGVATCRKSHCDCSTTDPPPNPVCCPQCDPSASCSHQELAHLTFRSGEQWIYQCQTCECLLGEIDCWQVECAPIRCETQVLGTTDCCPRCANEDPCGLSTFPTVTNQSQPNQRHFQQGGQLTQRPCPPLSPAAPAGRTAHWADNDCPNCNCKEGRLCCSCDLVGRSIGVGSRREQLSSPNTSSKGYDVSVEAHTSPSVRFDGRQNTTSRRG